MDISNNSSSVARSCWKKFYWRYNQKLTPIKQSSALSLGSAVHEAFDLFYKKVPKETIISELRKSFDEEIAQASPDEAEPLTINRYIAMGMFLSFPYFDTEFEVVESEKEFRVKLMRGVHFIGRVDGLVKKNGTWWLRELKTTGQTLRQFNQRIDTASQGTAYVWAMRQLGYDVKGIMYDYIKKPLLRKRVSEDQFEFGSRIVGDYRDRKDFYYGQIFSYRSEQEINEWYKDACSLSRDMVGKRRSQRYYRNTSDCYAYNYECPYKKICFEEKPDSLTLQLYFRKNGKQINEMGGTDDEKSNTQKPKSAGARRC
jgi:hypothetical protein